MLLYGPEAVGKTFFVKELLTPRFESELHYSLTYIDCNSISSQITSADAIDVALEYFLELYKQAKRLAPSVMVLDNLNALCPSISSDEQFNIIEQLKSLKFTALIGKLIERGEVGFLGIARHYMSVNLRLLDVGIMDSLVEMQPPSKELRYQVIKDVIAPQELKNKEIYLQKLSQLTEYFVAKDMTALFKEILLIQD